MESGGNLSRRNNRAAGVPKKSPIGADGYDPATSVYNAAAAAAAATAAPHLHAQPSKKRREKHNDTNVYKVITEVPFVDADPGGGFFFITRTDRRARLRS